MPRQKKERGRPTENPLPPRIDARPEEIAEAFFRFPADKVIKEDAEYRCGKCEQLVVYPAVLDRAGLCSKCA